MRAIKFRAYNTRIKQYDSFNIQESSAFPYFITSNIHIIEQYTGLKDKNGVEIYEGDIVKLDLNNYGYKECIVKWHKKQASWEFDNPKENYFTSDLMYNESHIEVIGNIHETT